MFCEIHKGVYQLRDKKSQKWGMFDWYNQLIPMEFDTIIPFKQFQPFTLAQKEGKYVVLYWPYDTKEIDYTSASQYDDMQIIVEGEGSIDFKYYLIASKNGSWGCLNWEDLSTIIPFSYSDPNSIPLSAITSY